MARRASSGSGRRRSPAADARPARAGRAGQRATARTIAFTGLSPATLPQWWPVLGLLLFSLALNANNLTNALVYDDNEAIVKNEAAHGLDKFGRIITTASWWPPDSGAVHYRPIPTLTYALNYTLHGLQPAGYHWINNALHGLTSGLVYLVLVATGVAAVPALIAAALFLAHPIHVEPVTWGIGRADLFAGGFTLLALLLHIHATRADGRRRTGLVAGGLLAALLAGLSKETGFMVPFVVLVWDFIRRDGLHPRTAWERVRSGDWRVYGLYLGLLLGFLGLRTYFVGGADVATVTEMASPLVGATFFERLLTGAYVGARYLGLLVWPAALSVDYSPDHITRVSSLADPRAWLGLGTVVLLCLSLAAAARWSRVTCFALVASLIVFAPASNVPFAIGTIMADREMYLPVLALCTPLALGLWEIRRWSAPGWLPVALAALLIFGYGARTLVRTSDWKDELTLFQAAYQVAPQSAMANKNLASLLTQSARNDEAIVLAEQAIAILPRFPDAHLVLGNAYFWTGRYAEAAEAYRTALALAPRHPSAILNLGAAYHVLGRSAEAIEAFDAALALNPRLDLAWFNRVHALVALGRLDEAESTLAEAVRRFPHHRGETEARQKIERARAGAVGPGS